MASNIIGFLGQRGTGKSTCAKYLIKQYDFTGFSFAEPLRQAAMSAFGLTERHVTTDKDLPFAHPMKVTVSNNTKLMDWYKANTPLKELPIGDVSAQFTRPRDIIRYIGELAKEVQPDIWPTMTLEQASDIERVVIDDVRFSVETQCLAQVPSTIVYLMTDASPDDHASELEVAQQSADYVIEVVRDGQRTPIDTLYSYLDQIVANVLNVEGS